MAEEEELVGIERGAEHRHRHQWHRRAEEGLCSEEVMGEEAVRNRKMEGERIDLNKELAYQGRVRQLVFSHWLGDCRLQQSHQTDHCQLDLCDDGIVVPSTVAPHLSFHRFLNILRHL